jgi:hypothetical protein
MRPQKLSIEAQDEIKKLQMVSAAQLKPSLRRAFDKARQAWRDSNKDEEQREPEFAELQQYLSDDEWQAFATAGTAADVEKAIIRIRLLHGIAEHDLDDKDGNIVPVSEALVDAIEQYSTVAREMASIVEEWNRPLANGSEPTS